MKTALVILMSEKSGIPGYVGHFAAREDFVPVIVCPEGACLGAYIPGGVICLKSESGMGIGTAIKRAFVFVRDKLIDCGFVIRVSADGGYTADDIMRVHRVQGYNPTALVLGMRSHNIFLKRTSRLRSAAVRQVFAIASGRDIRDVETGLRGFPREHIDSILNVDGEGAEYEVNNLLYGARNGVKICEAVIDTVYTPGPNSYGQHLREWMRVYGCAIRFALSSLFSFGVDLFLLLLLNHLLAPCSEVVALIISVGVARIVSCLINFYINHYLVFDSNEHVGRAMLKFAAVQALIMIASYILMHLLTITLNLPLAISKIISDTALFTASFVIQGKYVYKKEE